MKFDYSKLKGKIKEKCDTQKRFAKKMGMSQRTLSLKLTNKIEWKQSEMIKAKEILDSDTQDLIAYFFNVKKRRKMNSFQFRKAKGVRE